MILGLVTLEMLVIVSGESASQVGLLATRFPS